MTVETGNELITKLDLDTPKERLERVNMEIQKLRRNPFSGYVLDPLKRDTLLEIRSALTTQRDVVPTG